MTRTLRTALCAAALCAMAGIAYAQSGGLGTNTTTGTGVSTAGTSFEKLTETQQKDRAAAKVAALLKLLGSSGKNPTQLYQPTRYTGTSVGYDVAMPGTNLGAATFYTRPDASTEVWHVALNFSAADLANPSPLTQAYQSLTQFLGVPRHEMLSLVVSEGNATLPVTQLPPSMGTAMATFADTKGLIYLKKGVNLFTRIKAPDSPAFKTLQQAIMLGGEPQAGTLDISGSVGHDILGTLLKGGSAPDPDALAAEDTQKQQQGIPPVAFNITFPGVIPVPFNSMDATEAKKSFYMTIESTSFGMSYDQVNKQVGLTSDQEVTLWISGKDYKTKRKIEFNRDKSDTTNSTYELKASGEVAMDAQLFPDFNLRKVSLEGKAKVDIAKSTWVPGEVDNEAVRNSGITIGAQRGTAPTTTTTPSTSTAGSGNKKTTELSVALGVTVNAKGVGDLSGALGLTTEATSGRPRLKEVFFQFNGDPKAHGMRLASIPALANIPGVNDFSIYSLGIGIAPPPKGSSPEFYIYSDLEWVKPAIRGQMGLIVKNGRDVTFLSRVTNFELPKVIKAIDPNADEKTLRDTVGSFKLPDAILVASTAKAKTSADQMKVDSLPTMIQPMFTGIVASAADSVPIPAEGIGIIGKANFAADPNLKKSMDALGVQASGDLLIAASIGGFSTGAATFSVSVMLPTFKFPTHDAEMAKMFAVPSASGSFFVRVNTRGPDVAVGVATDLELSVPPVAGQIRQNSRVGLKGEVYAKVASTGVGIRVGGYTTTPWERPFGFDGITLNNAALLVGADAEGSIEIGLGTSMTFDFTAYDNKKIKLVSLEPKNKTDLRNNLADLQRRLNNKSSTDKLDVASGFIVAINASGVPKKLGLLHNASEISIPVTLDVFDLVIKGVVLGPVYDDLLRTTKEPALTTLKDIRSAFNANKAVRPSQVVRELSKNPLSVPLDAIYLTNVEFFFATPGAVLPGFPGLDGNVGLKIKGELWVTDHNSGRKSLVGKANIDLTLNGIDFGAIAKDIEKAYFSIASVTIDPLKAERDCPAGAFHDFLYASCWSCPAGYDRWASPVVDDTACRQMRVLQSSATDRGAANQPWNCPAGSFYDPRNQGECWSCPAGFIRSADAVDTPTACYKLDLSKITNYARVTKYGKAYGLIGTDCPAGQFWHIGDGYCYACPAGTIRNATDINAADACWGVGNQQVVSNSRATQVRGGRPAGSFLDIGLGKFYSCPAGYERTILYPVTSSQACERIEVNYAKAKSEPRGQLRNKATNLCFGAADGDISVGDKVVVQDCLDRDSRFQSWFVDSLQRLRPLQQLSVDQGKAAAMCLDVDGAKKDNGTPVKIWECTSNNPAQEWLISTDGLIRTKLDAGKCLSYSATGKPGDPMVIKDCPREGADLSRSPQTWHFGPALVKPVVPAGQSMGPVVFKLKDNPDTCLESGAPSGLKSCSTQTSQMWHLDGNGQIRSESGKTCLDATANSRTQNGLAVVLANCDASVPDNQKWLAHTNGSFINGFKRCLSVNEAGALQTRDCQSSSAASQTWVFVRTSGQAAGKEDAARRDLEAMRAASSTSGAAWNKMPGLAIDVGMGGGALWHVGTNAIQGGGYGIWRWDGKGWVAAPRSAMRIDVGPDGNAWIADSAGHVFRWTGSDWTPMPGENAQDIGIGADGTVWYIGGAKEKFGGYGVYRWNAGANKWDGMGAAGMRIDVDPKGVAWVVNDRNEIVRWTGGTNWEGLPGKARDIGIGANGSVFVVGDNNTVHKWDESTRTWVMRDGLLDNITVSEYGVPVGNSPVSKEIWIAQASFPPPPRQTQTTAAWTMMPGLANDIGMGGGSLWHIGTNAVAGGFGIWRWDGKNWVDMKGGAVRIDVDGRGNAFVANDKGEMYRYTGSGWQKIDGLARDIGIGENGTMWHIGTNAMPGGFGIWRWNAGTNRWDQMPGGAVRIDVDPKGNAWVVNDVGNIFRWTGSTWESLVGKARDIGIGADGSVFVVGPDGTIHKWDESRKTWVMRDGILSEITVSEKGVPFGANPSKQIWMGYP